MMVMGERTDFEWLAESAERFPHPPRRLAGDPLRGEGAARGPRSLVFPLSPGLTMSRFLAALLVLVAAESAASACSCVQRRATPAQRRADGARHARPGAVALVEVELLARLMTGASGRGERLRVRRTPRGPRAGQLRWSSANGHRPAARRAMSLSSAGAGGPRHPALSGARAVDSRGAVYRRHPRRARTYLLADTAFRAALLRQWGRRR